MNPFPRRLFLAPAERPVRPSFPRRAVFFALGVAAVCGRVLTLPRRLRHRRPAGGAAPVFLLEPFGLGDAIALQPLVRALCEAGRDVSVGTRRAWFPVFEPHPRLTLVECVPPWAARDGRAKYRGLLRRLRAFLPELRRAAAGRVGIDPRGDVRSVLALYAAGCAVVETLTHYFTANDCLVVPGAARRHAVRRDLVRWRLNGVFAPGLPLSPPSLAHLLPDGSPPSGRERTVALIPMTPWGGKRWEAPGWRAVADGIRARGLSPVVLCGPGEEDEARAACGAPGDAPDLRVCADVAAWVRELAGAAAAIAVNTGPMHVASVLGIPVVLLEGSSRLPLWSPPGPFSVVVEHQREVACAPCHQVGDCARCGRRCMRLVSADEVLRALDALRAGVGARAPEASVRNRPQTPLDPSALCGRVRTTP